MLDKAKSKPVTAKTLDGEAATGHPSINSKESINMKNIININSPNRKQKLRASFKLTRNGYESSFNLCGQQCKALSSLINSKNKGITALEVSCWAYRLAAYIHILRTKFDLNISTIREAHEGGFHARYHLLDKVEILEEVQNDPI